VVSHDKRIVPYADRVFEMEDGRLKQPEEAEGPPRVHHLPGTNGGGRAKPLPHRR
jgi:hypothetical protein